MKIKNDILKQLRIEHGLTQGDVATRLGITEATVSRYESGQIQRVSPNILLGYSKLLKVPITALYKNPETEWVTALEEAGLQDPRVAGFIEYLEERAQKDKTDDIKLNDIEIELISSYRLADEKTKHLVAYALGIQELFEKSKKERKEKED